ncbi:MULTISPECIES: GNAT family N-acetyltransferase [Asticcacaulis]|uniref:GNAT family N-acetyltransferase n=1 Tax=Asticcacaulis TaxID=76890 RepID=UPI001AE1C26B|nr:MULTISPECIES: GNAT family N-acetyltransferase [Asticcacaulis]MBP2160873.1 GNAT superfamily N-acetyltransferase [Asticcacaulis solisilvae]MDR6801923.1 GNAT superfamily N-acetyltransferase [Asticcacaulis sp. BE141]
MPYTPRTRPISLAELDIVRDLALQIWPKCHHNLIPPDHMDEMLTSQFDLDVLEQDMTESGHIYWVVSIGQTDVGFAAAHMEDGRVWITKLYVLSDYRGLGLGKILIQAVQDYFLPAHAMSVCVHKVQEAAVDFCLHHGFNIDREVPVSIGAYGFTDYLMHKDLRN